jgi:hypothetical protein
MHLPLNPDPMKKSFFIILSFLIIFSCSKTTDRQTVDCSLYYDIPAPLVCSGAICQSDTCITYFNIWKELFLAKNQMSEEYFNNHVTICNTGTYEFSDQGILFELTYKFKVDWFETKFEEDFMIWLSPLYLKSNPNIDLPGSILLSKDQISSNMGNPFFAAPMNTISPIDHLSYSSRKEAILVMAGAAGVNDMCTSNLSIQYMNVDNPPIGHPVLTASATLNLEENKCVSGIMDLATDYLKVEHSACFITFCFTKGTNIILNNNVTKSIEKIKQGDRILSFNQKTMQIENDIVKQVDSVKHSDIVHITFSDRTVNDNTFDHPYYVKNKGWCSYKPLQTIQKYNINTKQLLTGDTCFKYQDKKLIEVKVKSIKEKSGEVMMYNISRLEKNKSFFANGILVSDEEN